LKGTFLLGVGAQKAGTTWLYKALAAAPDVNFGITKEYHVWDAVYSEHCREFRVAPEACLVRRKGPSIRYRMQNEDGFYSKYFRDVLDTGCNLTGDITPSYACLSADNFRKIRSTLQAIGARLRVVFLMRDPFERNWSLVRMAKRKKGILIGDDEILLNCHALIGNILRTRYDQTVRNLRAAFPEDELHFGLYETMHQENEIQRLSDFLDVSIDRAAIGQRHNASPKVEAISPSTKAAVQDFYREVYEFCWTEFPDTRSYWQV